MYGLTKIAKGKYQHASGSTIELMPRRRLGRNGFQAAGWAVKVDGRETGRWSTLKRAAEEAGK